MWFSHASKLRGKSEPKTVHCVITCGDTVHGSAMTNVMRRPRGDAS